MQWRVNGSSGFFLPIPGWAASSLTMLGCSSAGRLEISDHSYSARLDTLYSFPRHENWQNLRKNHWQEVHFLFLLPSPAVKLKAFYLNHVWDLLGVGQQFLQSFSQSEFSPSDLRVPIVHLNWKKAVLIDASHNLFHPQKASDFCIFRFSPLPLPNLRFLSESLSF